jgi:hypothetical protein
MFRFHALHDSRRYTQFPAMWCLVMVAALKIILSDKIRYIRMTDARRSSFSSPHLQTSTPSPCCALCW